MFILRSPYVLAILRRQRAGLCVSNRMLEEDSYVESIRFSHRRRDICHIGLAAFRAADV